VLEPAGSALARRRVEYLAGGCSGPPQRVFRFRYSHGDLDRHQRVGSRSVAIPATAIRLGSGELRPRRWYARGAVARLRGRLAKQLSERPESSVLEHALVVQPEQQAP